MGINTYEIFLLLIALLLLCTDGCMFLVPQPTPVYIGVKGELKTDDGSEPPSSCTVKIFKRQEDDFLLDETVVNETTISVHLWILPSGGEHCIVIKCGDYNYISGVIDIDENFRGTLNLGVVEMHK